MITTSYNWVLDQRRKVIYNKFGRILRDGRVWHFQGSYFDSDWAAILTQSPLEGCESLQAMIRNVESGIARYRRIVRRKSYHRLLLVAVYTCFLVGVSISILFAWAKSAGY